MRQQVDDLKVSHRETAIWLSRVTLRPVTSTFGPLWSCASVGAISSMKAVQLVGTRIAYSESARAFMYRLAYVVRGECVLRYDNEVGKGDHRHFGKKKSVYAFTTPDQLITDFQKDIARWNHENSNS
jgi:hypothetical protein